MDRRVRAPDSSGRISIAGPVYGLQVEPAGEKAVYPLTLTLDGTVDNPRLVDSGRTERFRASEAVLSGAQEGSQWLVTVLQAPDEEQGAGRDAYLRPVRLFNYASAANLVVPVGNPVGEIALPTLEDAAEEYQRYDVSRFRSFVARVGFGTAYTATGGAPTLKVSLYLHADDNTGPLNRRLYQIDVPATLSAPNDAWCIFHFGEGVAEASAAQELRRGLRWPGEVSLNLEVELGGGATAGNLTLFGGLRADLWGIP